MVRGWCPVSQAWLPGELMFRAGAAVARVSTQTTWRWLPVARADCVFLPQALPRKASPKAGQEKMTSTWGFNQSSPEPSLSGARRDLKRHLKISSKFCWPQENLMKNGKSNVSAEVAWTNVMRCLNKPTSIHRRQVDGEVAIQIFEGKHAESRLSLTW